MSKLRIGVLGLGMMGNTHIDAYRKRDDVELVAVADANPDRLSGREVAGGNVEGQAQGDSLIEGVRRYPDAAELIEKEALDIVDICLPTPAHLKFALIAIEKGRHVLVEKPVCRTAEQAEELRVAADASDRIIMPAMCIRFWPGWDTLIETVKDQRFGKLKSLSIQRLASHPGGPFYLDPEACGGALLDLHIHDTDFIYAALGKPQGVRTVGYSKITGGPDHISTQYLYDDALVVAEGGWAMAEGFPFTMRYDANFESATVRFDLGAEHPLTVLHTDGLEVHPELNPEMGYWHEIDDFISCVKEGRKPKVVTVADAVESLAINEAERASLATGRTVSLV